MRDSSSLLTKLAKNLYSLIIIVLKGETKAHACAIAW
jgi:hypothetical protein